MTTGLRQAADQRRQLAQRAGEDVGDHHVSQQVCRLVFRQIQLQTL